MRPTSRSASCRSAAPCASSWPRRPTPPRRRQRSARPAAASPAPLVIRLRYFVKVPYHRRPRCSAAGPCSPATTTVPVLRRATPTRIDHVRAPQPRRRARVGERGGRVPPVQPAQARPHARRGRHAPGPAPGHAPRAGLGGGRRRPRARALEAVPGPPASSTSGVVSRRRRHRGDVERDRARRAEFHARDVCRTGASGRCGRSSRREPAARARLHAAGRRW